MLFSFPFESSTELDIKIFLSFPLCTGLSRSRTKCFGNFIDTLGFFPFSMLTFSMRVYFIGPLRSRDVHCIFFFSLLTNPVIQWGDSGSAGHREQGEEEHSSTRGPWRQYLPHRCRVQGGRQCWRLHEPVGGRRHLEDNSRHQYERYVVEVARYLHCFREAS